MKRFPLFLAVLLSLVPLRGLAAETIGADEIVRLMKDEPQSTMLLDVRTPGEYDRGHIKGTVLIPMRSVPAYLNRIPRDKKIVVICASGARSGAVAEYLRKNGYPWAKNYSGGMMDWSRRGLPMEGR